MGVGEKVDSLQHHVDVQRKAVWGVQRTEDTDVRKKHNEIRMTYVRMMR